MSVTVEQNIPRGKGRQMIQVEHMAVSDVDQPLPHRQHGVIRQHREIEHHLVYLGVAVAPHTQQLGRKAVQQRNHLFGGVIPGQVVAGAVVEQVSQKQQAVGLLPFKGLLQLLRIIIGAVQV